MSSIEEFRARLTRLANLILVLAGLACLFTLSYFVYNYAWTGRRQMASWKGALIYYVLPAFLTLLFFASLRLRAAYRINLALVLCSAGASIYGGETLITVWSALPSYIAGQNRRVRIASAEAQGLKFDARTTLEVIQDYRSSGLDAVPDVFPMALLEKRDDGTRRSLVAINGAEIVPLAGFSNKRVVLCNESGTWVDYTSDECGFNNPPGFWSAGPMDIAVIGDSYAEGMCVCNPDSFVAQIRRRYPKTINLGKQGAGPLTELAAIKEYARIVRPRIVLWFYYENDLVTDLPAEKTSPLLMRYLTKGFTQDLLHRQREINGVLARYVETAEFKSRVRSKIPIKPQEVLSLFENRKQLADMASRILRLSELRQRLGLVQGVSTADPTVCEAQIRSMRKQLESMKDDLDLFYRIAVEAKRCVNDWGGNIYFVFLPSWSRYAPGQIGRPERDQVLLAVQKAGIPIIDIHRAFIAQKNPLVFFPPFPVTSHYNKLGHHLVAEEVLATISEDEKLRTVPQRAHTEYVLSKGFINARRDSETSTARTLP